MIEMRIIGPNMDMLARSGKSSGHKPLSATPASHARQAVMRGRLDRYNRAVRQVPMSCRERALRCAIALCR